MILSSRVKSRWPHYSSKVLNRCWTFCRGNFLVLTLCLTSTFLPCSHPSHRVWCQSRKDQPPGVHRQVSGSLQGDEAAGLRDGGLCLHLQHLQRSHPQVNGGPRVGLRLRKSDVCFLTASRLCVRSQRRHHQHRRKGDSEEDGRPEHLQGQQLKRSALAVFAQVARVLCCLRYCSPSMAMANTAL